MKKRFALLVLVLLLTLAVAGPAFADCGDNCGGYGGIASKNKIYMGAIMSGWRPPTSQGEPQWPHPPYGSVMGLITGNCPVCTP
jgi:hypothetical protein